jgi:hypothetical protein
MPSGVKVFVNLFDLLNHHVRREETVERPLHRTDIHRAIRLEVGYLAQCVDPGIRSSGAEQLNCLTCEEP